METFEPTLPVAVSALRVLTERQTHRSQNCVPDFGFSTTASCSSPEPELCQTTSCRGSWHLGSSRGRSEAAAGVVCTLCTNLLITPVVASTHSYRGLVKSDAPRAAAAAAAAAPNNHRQQGGTGAQVDLTDAWFAVYWLHSSRSITPSPFWSISSNPL